jgi:hypothetical protein
MDNGKEFVGKAFMELVEEWGCKQIKTSPPTRQETHTSSGDAVT